jgi:hypothetical protein
VGAGRFLANERVSLSALIEGWSDQTSAAVAGRHVLAIQDTSEFNFRTKPGRRRGLGEIGKGSGRGVIAHVMAAVDAESGHCLGLVSGAIYTRKGRVKTPHAKRSLKDKESRRWLETAQAAKSKLAEAARVTVVADRESDIYAEWAQLPEANFHLLTRVMHDRAVIGGGLLSEAANRFTFVASRAVSLTATPLRAARRAELSLRFGEVQVRRPPSPGQKGLPKSVKLTLVEVVEREPPAGIEPIYWRLLTTHQVADADQAFQIVDWYRRRWIIEQLFRLMKTQGLQVEDSELPCAERLMKLTAIAAKAAAITLQLVQARDGATYEAAANAFGERELEVLDALAIEYRGNTAKQKNPHTPRSLGWAAWLIARLGGWDGYASSKKPGPITMGRGLDEFFKIARGWELRDVCMP